MVLLQSKDEFKNMALLDTSNGEVSIFFRSSGNNYNESLINGSYATINNVFLSLYRNNGLLYVKIGESVVPVTDEVFTTWVNSRKSKLILNYQNGKKLEFVYKSIINSISDYQYDTAFSEEEDFDFCLFVHNVISSPERRKSIYRTNEIAR